MWTTSRYNLAVPLSPSGVVLYNSRTGASHVYAGADSTDLANALCSYPLEVGPETLPSEITERLVAGGFLVPTRFDELAAVRETFGRATRNAPVIVTITMTNNCNLGCFYCFQKRGQEELRPNETAAVVQQVRSLLLSSRKSSLHVDWYGGEPMLNRQYLEELSSAIQCLCNEVGARYSASMLTNGTLWPEDAVAFARANAITRVQITFDGFGASHNKIRRYLEKSTSAPDQFSAAVNLVDKLKSYAVVDVRFNLDGRNTEDAIQLAHFGKERGWFVGDSKVKFQLAKLTPYSKKVDFIRNVELTYVEFEAIRDRVREIVPQQWLDRTADMDKYPNPRESVCAAVARDSVVIGADGALYNCGLQVTEPERAVGSLISTGSELQTQQKEWWLAFDPTKVESCSKCTFLPVCWGACPKLHLEKDQASLDEQSLYWRAVLPRRLSSSLGLNPLPGFTFSKAQQFKSEVQSN